MTKLKNKYENPQDECINEHEGKWLVIAGPGTGKTYTVTNRIKNMISKGIEPESILCLTFSDTGAKEMKNRIGEDYDVDVFTFHKFCLNIIEENKEEFDFENLNIITDSHKRTLVSECIDKAELKAYKDEKGDSYKFIKEILDGIDEIKLNRVKEDDYSSAIKNNPAWEMHLKTLRNEYEERLREEPDKEVPKYMTKNLNAAQSKVDKAYELWDLYQDYSKKMKDAGYIDFNDMIDMVLKKFEEDENPLLETICEKYKYVIVDEYQDTNTAQNEIVFNLAKYCPNVFVVGDDDQIIYTFQGAHLDTIEKFLTRFNNNGEKVNVRCFSKNYRSTQSILDFAGELASLQDTGFCEYMLRKGDKLSPELKDLYSNNPPPKNRLLSKFNITDNYGNKIEKKLVTAPDSAVKDMNKPVEFTTYYMNDDERDAIVSKIIKINDEFKKYNEKATLLARKEGKTPKLKKLSEIAILAKSNDELEDYSNYLKANGIPVEIASGKDIFKINSVNVLITYIQFLTNPEKYSDKILSYLLLKPFHLDSRDYKTICKYKNYYNSVIEHLEALVKKCSSETEIKERIEKEIPTFSKNTLIYDIERLTKSEKYVLYDKDKLKKFVETYKYLKDYITGENYKTSLLVIGERTGIFNYYFCKDNINKLENIKGIKKLLEIADAYFDVHKDEENSFSMFVEYLTKIIQSDTEIKLDKPEVPMDAVQLSTYHSSKGREFEYVFMPNLVKSKWESFSLKNRINIPIPAKKGDTIEIINEREALTDFLDYIKTLYVGMTRAKHSLFLSYSLEGNSTAGKLSWFIEKLIGLENLKQKSIIHINEPEQYDVSDNYITPTLEYDYEKEFCDNIPNSFSASAIKKYKNCPKQYFYNNILGINGDVGPDSSISFGTAMHSAFEYSINQVMKTKKYPDYDEVCKVFEDVINEGETENADELKKSGREKIFSKGGYYDKFKALVNTDDLETKEENITELNSEPTGKHTIYAEFPLHYEMEIPSDWEVNVSADKKIILKGYIDRLDKTPDGEFYIYDYKSRDNCLSIPPSDDYFKQMTLYKYILEKQIEGAKVSKACFLLPLEKNGNTKFDLAEAISKPAKGKTLSNEENIINDMLNCIQGIYSLNFDVPKSPNCKYCNLKQFCVSKTV